MVGLPRLCLATTLAAPGMRCHRTSAGGTSMRFKSMGVFAGLALGVIGFSSCQAPYHEDKERYVFVASNIHLPYWEEAQAGLRDVAKQMGVKAEMVGPEKFDP